jgi:hypothetical protein
MGATGTPPPVGLGAMSVNAQMGTPCAGRVGGNGAGLLQERSHSADTANDAKDALGQDR